MKNQWLGLGISQHVRLVKSLPWYWRLWHRFSTCAGRDDSFSGLVPLGLLLGIYRGIAVWANAFPFGDP